MGVYVVAVDGVNGRDIILAYANDLSDICA